MTPPISPGSSRLWLNGAPVTQTAAFDVSDRGLLLGDGTFDTALVLDGAVVWRTFHERRLLANCAALGIHVDPARIAGAYDAAAQGLACGSLRITVTRGPGPRGVAPPAGATPTVLASSAAMAAPLAFQPLSLWPSPVRRNETSLTARIKSLAYLDAVLETAAARAAGCDEPLFVNTRGVVACSGVGNIFILEGESLVTAPLDAGALDGAARAASLRLAPVAGLRGMEAEFGVERLARADAVYISNSLRLLAPVSRLGDLSLAEAPAAFAALRRALVADVGAPQAWGEPPAP